MTSIPSTCMTLEEANRNSLCSLLPEQKARRKPVDDTACRREALGDGDGSKGHMTVARSLRLSCGWRAIHIVLRLRDQGEALRRSSRLTSQRDTITSPISTKTTAIAPRRKMDSPILPSALWRA